MIRIFQAFSPLPNHPELLQQRCCQNKLPLTMITSLSLEKAATLYLQILEMYKIQPVRAQAEWLDHEVKLLCWVLVSESFLQKKLIQNFADNDWLQIQTYFPPKSLLMLQYEYRKLLLKTDKDSYCQWEQTQKQSLIKIMSQKKQPYPWEEIARKLYGTCGRGTLKTSKQCREHWYNHLDPTKKHGQWAAEEDLQIVRFSLKSGHKWSLLCKNAFSHRTEHMVKNRFNSILRKYKDGQLYSANNEKKILKRIVRKLEEEIAQTTQNNYQHPQTSQPSHQSPLTLYQVPQLKPKNNINKHPTPHAQLLPPFPLPFAEQYPTNKHSSGAAFSNRESQVGSMAYGYSGVGGIAGNVFGAPNFYYNYPMWPHPGYFWFGQKP